MADNKVDKDETNVMIEECKGPNSKFVKLVSSDGHEFILNRNHAMLSSTIKDMLSGPGEFDENETNIINLKKISSDVLQIVCSFLSYKYSHYHDSKSEIPIFKIPSNIALDVLMAADFFDL